jgi:hypothetical protein
LDWMQLCGGGALPPDGAEPRHPGLISETYFLNFRRISGQNSLITIVIVS